MGLTATNLPEGDSRKDKGQALSSSPQREIIFETARLQLVRANLIDIPHFVAVYCSQVMMAHLGSPFSEEQAAARIDTWNTQWNELGWGGGVVIDKNTQASIGTAKIILTKLPDYLGSHEVGYMILPQYQGNRFASEITGGAVKYLFERARAQQIVADVHPDNSPSNRVLQKLGFLNQGIKSYNQADFPGYDQQRIWLLTQDKWKADNKT